MKRALSIAAVAFALATGAFAVDAAVKPDTASALVFAGSCGWSTDTTVWHWSPAYGVYYVYQGHVWLNGTLDRSFLVYSPVQGWYQHWYVYCG